jgi:hypothetical protein
MIIDPQPPDPPGNRWPFLFAWSLAAMTIVGALFLTHTPASQQAPVALNTPPVPSTSVSSANSVQRLPAGQSGITQYPVYVSVGGLPLGSIVYVDNASTWIAVGPNHNVFRVLGCPDGCGVEDIPPHSQTTNLR